MSDPDRWDMASEPLDVQDESDPNEDREPGGVACNIMPWCWSRCISSATHTSALSTVVRERFLRDCSAIQQRVHTSDNENEDVKGNLSNGQCVIGRVDVGARWARRPSG